MPKTRIIKKNLNDKFYTKPEIAKKCFENLLSFNLNANFYIEPSAGNGSFYSILPDNFKIGLDILPEFSEIIKQDYFDFVNYFDVEKTIVIGNPPFGERNNLTRKFIKKACLDSCTVAFVLPEVFEKPIMQKCFSSDFKLIFSEKLPSNSFLLDNEDYNVHSVFQIWTKLDVDFPDLRKKYFIPNCSSDFYFVQNKNISDFFVFGSAPNNCILPDSVSEKNRGYYIKIKENVDHNFVFSIFRNGNWKNFGKSSVNGGVFWLTKQEIVDGYEKIKNEQLNKKNF